MTKGLHINISIDEAKVQTFIEEKIKDGTLAEDTALDVNSFVWEIETVGADEMVLFPVGLKAR